MRVCNPSNMHVDRPLPSNATPLHHSGPATISPNGGPAVHVTVFIWIQKSPESGQQRWDGVFTTVGGVVEPGPAELVLSDGRIGQIEVTRTTGRDGVSGVGPSGRFLGRGEPPLADQSR
jgi:hypothetical protein